MRYGKLSNGFLIEWEIEVRASLKEVWYFASHTNRLNAAIGSGAVEYKEEPNLRGGSFLYGKTSNSGIISEYREYPYEWIENQYSGVERIYTKGPLKKMLYDTYFTETDNGFKIKFFLQFELSSLFFKPFVVWEVKKNAIPRFNRAFQQLEDFSQQKTNLPLPVFGFTPSSQDKKIFSETYTKFSNIKAKDELKKKLVTYILDTPDNDLVKIKPYAVAKNIKESKREVLEFFLRSTREGLFDMNWDLICPSCRGPKTSYKHLYEMTTEVHCPTCNIDYSGEFDKSVELTFTPTEKLRKVIGAVFCFGGPGNTPHFKIQWRVKGNSLEKLQYELKEGTYRIFSPQRKDTLLLNVNNSFPETTQISYPHKTEKIECAPSKIELLFQNEDSEEILVRLEKTAWLDDVTTAFEVTSLQEFRDLFSSEVLKPGQEISVKSIAILFTDLKGSTKFYNEKGDAFAYKFVSDHFDVLIAKAIDLEGAIVKTIGDAVMAIFVNPINAVQYAILIQKEIQKIIQDSGVLESITLKVGGHFGPALAVTMNEKLDYFGSTVNLAARTEGQCKGNDIVITKELFEYPGIKEFLKQQNLQVEHFTTVVKGFSESFEMVRIQL